jgi:selenium metabolism protein YedF
MKIDRDMLLFLKSSSIGENEPDLGEKLLKSFLAMLLESGTLPARIICLNTGIFLTTADSPVAELMKTYEQHGTEVFSCGTCLDYFSRKDKLIIGKPTNMKETVEAMLIYKKILSPC